MAGEKFISHRYGMTNVVDDYGDKNDFHTFYLEKLHDGLDDILLT